MADPLRVMIVEDEALVLMQLQALLEDAGHDVVATAMSSGEAIGLISDRRPELVLLDLHLQGGSSGIDVARSVAADQDVCVVFMTANSNKLDRDLEGAAAVISKPFSDSTFDRAITYIGECIRTPPPLSEKPSGLRIAPAYSARLFG